MRPAGSGRRPATSRPLVAQMCTPPVVVQTVEALVVHAHGRDVGRGGAERVAGVVGRVACLLPDRRAARDGPELLLVRAGLARPGRGSRVPPPSLTMMKLNDAPPTGTSSTCRTNRRPQAPCLASRRALRPGVVDVEGPAGVVRVGPVVVDAHGGSATAATSAGGTAESTALMSDASPTSSPVGELLIRVLPPPQAVSTASPSSIRTAARTRLRRAATDWRMSSSPGL